MASAQIVCGLDHTLALARGGEAYAFGDNSLDQLGRSGSMGVHMPQTNRADWLIRDEDNQVLHFTKVSRQPHLLLQNRVVN